MKVMLDAGHGGRDYGAVFRDRREKDDNLKLARDVGEVLMENGVEVSYTRNSDVYLTPYERAMKANGEGVDYFVSFHRNAFPEPNQASGVETFAYDTTGRGAKVGNAIGENLGALGFVTTPVQARPNLVVLKRTEMPATLVQAGFIDSDVDNELFDNEYEAVVEAIAQGILDTISPKNVGSVDIGDYTVQVGVFRVESNARRLLEELVSEGFPAYVRYDDGYYKVFVGDYQTMEEAVNEEKMLRDYGYATVLIKR